MNSNLSFSFIIPALNEEDCIGDCIRSIRKQSETPLEIIVVDNGGVDRTAAIAEELGCTVTHKVKLGLIHARNRGAALAGGDILCFIDADGVLSSGWLRVAQWCFAKPGLRAFFKIADGGGKLTR